jgi:hypothetical protein
MRSGDRPGLQNRRVAGNPVIGGFDPHSLPPILRTCHAPLPMKAFPTTHQISGYDDSGQTCPSAWFIVELCMEE